MFSIFLLKQVKYFLADKNTCVILCEFLNKVYYYYYHHHHHHHHHHCCCCSITYCNKQFPMLGRNHQNKPNGFAHVVYGLVELKLITTKYSTIRDS